MPDFFLHPFNDLVIPPIYLGFLGGPIPEVGNFKISHGILSINDHWPSGNSEGIKSKYQNIVTRHYTQTLHWWSECLMDSRCLRRGQWGETLTVSVMLCHCFPAQKLSLQFPLQAAAAGRAAVMMTCEPLEEEESPWLSSQSCLWMSGREEDGGCCSGKDQKKKMCQHRLCFHSLLFSWEEIDMKNTSLLGLKDNGNCLKKNKLFTTKRYFRVIA